MKNLFSTLFIVLGITLLVSSCGRKTTPHRSTVLKPKVTPDRIDDKQYVKPAIVLDSLKKNAKAEQDSQKVITDSYTQKQKQDSIAKAANVNVPEDATVLIDSHGELQMDSLQLPTYVSHNLDSIQQVTRAYTPNEAKNLAFRYKQIPPRVLFVPENLAKKGVKGYYYRYQNKFWYWKQSDGFYYLDKNYYR